MKIQTTFRMVFMTLLTVATLAALAAQCFPTPTPAPTEAPPAPTEAPPAPTEALPTEAPPTEALPTEALPTEAPPTEAPPTEAAPTEAAPTEAPSEAEAPAAMEVPVGNEWRAREWDEAMADVLGSRRASGSDVTGGRAVVFDATDCMRCHENAEGVEGQIFYGPDFTTFAEDQVWVNEAGESVLAVPDEGLTFSRDYDFIITHIPEKVGATIYEKGAIPPNVIRQNP
jgi:hypothetical protein